MQMRKPLLAFIVAIGVAMVFGFLKRSSSPEFRMIDLPGEIGTAMIPSDLVVESEDDSTLMAYPKNSEDITIRFTYLSFLNPNSNKLTAKEHLSKQANKLNLEFHDLGDSGFYKTEEETLSENEWLIMHFWQIGQKNTIVLISATVTKEKQNSRPVKSLLTQMPKIVESVKVVKWNETIHAEGRQIETTITRVEYTKQDFQLFDEIENKWLQKNLEMARQLSIRYGNCGELDPDELDLIFSRWLSSCVEKETDEVISNSLGAAFGEYLVENLGFQWYILTDDLGMEYVVKHTIGDTVSYPVASVKKRIESGQTDFFAGIYAITLNNLRIEHDIAP